MKSPRYSHGVPVDANGVYALPVDIAPLHAAAQNAGLRWIAIDLKRARGRRAVLNAFARDLRFPETFGGNWDALADCLQDLSWLQGGGWVVVLRGAADFAAAKSAEHEVLLEILGATARYWREHGRVFVVLSDATGLAPLIARAAR